MATIQKFTRSKGIVYRVLIRKAGTKPISKTFTSKKLAIQFAESINSNREFFEAYGYQNNVKIKLSELIIEYLNLDDCGCLIHQPYGDKWYGRKNCKKYGQYASYDG